MALCTAMTVCLYCVTFADFSFCMKICFGIAAALLYLLMVFVPCCIRKRKKKDFRCTPVSWNSLTKLSQRTDMTLCGCGLFARTHSPERKTERTA